MPSKRDHRPDPKPDVECAEVDCSTWFTPQRSTARYCSATCRQRAADRRNRPAKRSAEVDLAGHPLVRAVESELRQVGALETVDGQVALQLARRLATPDESGASSLAKELRASLTAAVVGKSGTAPEDSSAVDDEVEQARRRREAKAAKAAKKSS